MGRPWFPLYTGDYIKDTPLLTLEEHGAYILLMCHYWNHTNVPTNVNSLYKICRCTSDAEQHAVKSVAETFFPVIEGVRRNKRLDEELQKASEISDVRRKAVNKRYENRPTNVDTNVGTSEPTNGPTKRLLSQSQSHNIKSLAAKEKPSRKKPLGEKTPHATFMGWWCFAFKAVFGKPYLVTAKDGAIVKKLLANSKSVYHLMGAAAYFLTYQDNWLADKCRDIPLFMAQFNRLPNLEEIDFTDARAAGIVPPAGTKFEGWDWEEVAA